jgi:hypothetical protein
VCPPQALNEAWGSHAGGSIHGALRCPLGAMFFTSIHQGGASEDKTIKSLARGASKLRATRVISRADLEIGCNDGYIAELEEWGIFDGLYETYKTFRGFVRAISRSYVRIESFAKGEAVTKWNSNGRYVSITTKTTSPGCLPW